MSEAVSIADKAAEQALAGRTFEAWLDQVLDELRELLLAKNRAYGNAALDPVRVFSDADPVEQIKVRLDDKISRWVRGQAAGEDVPTDLMGYLVLLKIAGKIADIRAADAARG